MDKTNQALLKQWPVLPVILMLLFGGASGESRAEPPSQPDTPDSRFGVVEAYHEPEMADELGIGWERIIFYWSELEKKGRGDWNEFHAPFHRLDREIEGGREIVGLLVHTPAWATDGLPGVGLPDGLYLPPDDSDNLWAVFVRRTVETYQGRVSRWIIWNEPDIALDVYGTQWQGTTEDYYQLVKTAYIVAHEVDPDVKIHLGGLTYWHNPVYLREYLTAASQDPTAGENGYYFDVVSAHIYFKPETTIDIIGALREMLGEFGLQDKPIWINETNAPPYDDPAQPWDNPGFAVTQEMQASFLLQEFALALSLGVERIGVYKWIDEPPLTTGFEPYGLIRTDRTTRPAFEAFRVILTHYAGTNNARRIEAPEMQTVILDRGEKATRVFWARTPYTVLVVVPALADSALRVEQDRTEKTIHPILGRYILVLDAAPCGPDQECLMGGAPLLLVEDTPIEHLDDESLDNRFVIDLTPRVCMFGIGMGILGMTALIGGIAVIRKRRRIG